jgi:hypothetical protein
MRPLSRGAGRRAAAVFVALFALLGAAPRARADEATSEEELDRKTYRGFGPALNFRGIAADFDADFTYSTADSRAPVWATRLSARALVLPAVLQATPGWGAWVGVRAAGLQFQRPAGSVDTTPDGFIPANVAPTIGVVIESIGDEVRFEADVAPVLSMAESSELASQAAIVAAMATAPHDDIIFVPNLQGGGRLRLALTRRFRWAEQVSLQVGAEIESGYAKTASTIGASEGGTGGGEVNARLYIRCAADAHRGIPEGIAFDAVGDVGYTAIWPANVVVPLLVGGGMAVEFSRLFEAHLRVARFSASPLGPTGNFALESWSTTLGIRWSLGVEPGGRTRRDIDIEPELEQEQDK